MWIGLDQKKPIGHNMTGAEAALPIWIDVMKAWIGDRKEAAEVRAARQHRLRVGRQGRRVGADGTPGAISEAFIAGTQPGGMR